MCSIAFFHLSFSDSSRLSPGTILVMCEVSDALPKKRQLSANVFSFETVSNGLIHQFDNILITSSYLSKVRSQPNDDQ